MQLKMLSISRLDFELGEVAPPFSFCEIKVQTGIRCGEIWLWNYERAELCDFCSGIPISMQKSNHIMGCIDARWRLATAQSSFSAIGKDPHSPYALCNICLCDIPLLLTPLAAIASCVCLHKCRFSLWLRVKSTQGYYCTLKRISHVYARCAYTGVYGVRVWSVR